MAFHRGGYRGPRRHEPLHRTNERIRVPAVRVVDEEGEPLGVMDTRDAVQRARDAGLDLVEIAPNAQPPVCRIVDYGKFLYEQKKRQHEQKKKQVQVVVKEIKFRPGTDDHDYQYRLKRALEWIADGDKVRAAIAFRGREMSHRELGSKILKRLTEALSEVADVEVAPKMEGYQMFAIFIPKKGQKPAAKKSDDAKPKADAKAKAKNAKPEVAPAAEAAPEVEAAPPAPAAEEAAEQN